MKELRSVAEASGVHLEFIREGGNHEIWTIGGERLVIPRHREINEFTAQGVLKRAKEVT